MQFRGKEKRSFKVDLKEYVKGQSLAGVTKLNPHSAVTDASWMNEVLSYRVYREAGVVAPRSAFARVYVSVPGKYEKKYFGLYSLIEELDGNFAEENYKTKDGLFLKPATDRVVAGESVAPEATGFRPTGVGGGGGFGGAPVKPIKGFMGPRDDGSEFGSAADGAV